MIRALLLVLVFAAGLAAAALWQGRMHHLRMAVPDRLPGWTEAVADDAGVRDGAMALPARGFWPATRLSWTARRPSRDGWLWEVALTGEGVALQGQVTLDYAGDVAVLSGVSGSLDLAAMVPSPLPVQGIVGVETLTGQAEGLRGSPILSGALAARVPALSLEGADFGAGPLTASLDETGAWQAQLALNGGVSEVDASLQGDLAAATAQLEAFFADGAALPPAMRAMLSAVAQPEGQGWRLTATLPLP